MSRYPNEGAARFDQQFAETTAERNARLHKARRVVVSPPPAPPITAGSDCLNAPTRSASEMAIAVARLALARIANGDPQAIRRLALVALEDLETLVPSAGDGR